MRRIYEARYRGRGRWEVRSRRPWVSGPVRTAAATFVGAGVAYGGWQRLGPAAQTTVVGPACLLGAAAAVAVLMRRP